MGVGSLHLPRYSSSRSLSDGHDFAAQDSILTRSLDRLAFAGLFLGGAVAGQRDVGSVGRAVTQARKAEVSVATKNGASPLFQETKH